MVRPWFLMAVLAGCGEGKPDSGSTSSDSDVAGTGTGTGASATAGPGTGATGTGTGATGAGTGLTGTATGATGTGTGATGTGTGATSSGTGTGMPTGSTGTGTGTSIPSTDTAPDTYLEVREFRVTAFVGWDADTGRVVRPIVNGSPRFTGLVFTLSAAGGSPSCELQYDWLDYEALEAGSLADGFVFGVAQRQGNGIAPFTDCIALGFDPAEFTGSGKFAGWEDFQVALQLGVGPLDPDLADWVTPSTPTPDFDIDEFFPGLFTSETLGIDEGDYDPYSIWQAYAMDVDHNVDLGRPLDRYEVADTYGLSTGYYTYRQSVYWSWQ